MSAFDDALTVITRLEEVQKALEKSTDDMELMGKLLDELNDLQKKADRSNVYSLACVCRRTDALRAASAAHAAAPVRAGAKSTR
jgi:hypothetical protein